MPIYGTTPDATTSSKGKVELATDAETLTGTMRTGFAGAQTILTIEDAGPA